MTYSYRPKGVCSQKIDLEIEDGIVQSVCFTGGCNGNTKGIAALVAGRKVDEVIDILLGTNCGMRGTSCPDQLAKALIEAKEQAGKEAE